VDFCPQRPERESKQNFTTYLADRWQRKDQLPTPDTLTKGFLFKQLEEGEITWYTEMMELRKLRK
jgi:hypothetical protein